MKTRSLFGVLLACAFLAGCAATPQSSKEADEFAKRFESQKDAGVIYVYRDDRVGPQNQLTATINGRVIGQVLPTTFFRLVEFPGQYVIAIAGPTNARVTLQTQAGAIYFVSIQAYGDDPDSQQVVMKQVAPLEAERAILACCDRMENWRRGQQRLVF